MRWSKLLGVALVAMMAAQTAAAAVTINGSLETTDPTITGRLFRDGTPSSCLAPKAFPGVFGASNLEHKTHSTHNNGAERCVTVDVDVGTCGTDVFVAAYAGSFDPSNLATNYLGDQGASSTGSFSFVAPAGSPIVLMASRVNSGAVAACTYTLTSTELDPQAFAPPRPVPTLSEWGMIILSSLMALGSIVALRRRNG